MATIERALARGRRLAMSDLATIGRELHIARFGRGWSLAELAGRTGISTSKLSRLERGLLRRIAYEDLVLVGAVVGRDIRMREFPGPDPTLDAGQLAVYRRLRAIVPEQVAMPVEVGLPMAGDQRAWDTVLRGLEPEAALAATDLPADISTRFIDAQGQLRRVLLKRRDGGHASVLVVVADTHRNRRALREAAPLLATDFPIAPRAALAALRAGKHPGGSAVVCI
jgi:transcriptional regulator with XRE-family HTH domain